MDGVKKEEIEELAVEPLEFKEKRYFMSIEQFTINDQGAPSTGSLISETDKEQRKDIKQKDQIIKDLVTSYRKSKDDPKSRMSVLNLILETYADFEVYEEDPILLSRFRDTFKEEDIPKSLIRDGSRKMVREKKKEKKNNEKRIKQEVISSKDENEPSYFEDIREYRDAKYPSKNQDIKQYASKVYRYLKKPLGDNDHLLNELYEIHAQRMIDNNIHPVMEKLVSIFTKKSGLNKPVYMKEVNKIVTRIKQEELLGPDIETLVPPPPNEFKNEDTVWIKDSNGDVLPIAQVVDTAFEILMRKNKIDPVLFNWGGAFSVIYADEEKKHQIEFCSGHRLRYELSSFCDWINSNMTQDGLILSPTNPSKSHSDLLFSLNASGLPPLKGITSHPIVNDDGTIDTDPGYHEKSGYYLPESEVIKLEDMTVEEAKDRIQDIFGEFPFEDEQSFTQMLSIPLTMLMRPIIKGPTPIHAVIAESRSGKSLLVQCIHLIVTGRSVSETQAPRYSEEWRKKLLADLTPGPEMIFYDNAGGNHIYYEGEKIDIPIDAPALASAVTAERFTDRVLASSKNVSLPVNCAWVMSMHELFMTEELTNRSLSIHLNKEKKLRKFKYRNIKEQIKNNRSYYLSAFFTLIKDWIKNGSKLPDSIAIDGFESWTSHIYGVLSNAGYNHFLSEEQEKRYEDNLMQHLSFVVLAHIEKKEGAVIQCKKLFEFVNNKMPEKFKMGRENDKLLSDFIENYFKLKFEWMTIGDNEIGVYKGLAFKVPGDPDESEIEEVNV